MSRVSRKSPKYYGGPIGPSPSASATTPSTGTSTNTSTVGALLTSPLRDSYTAQMATTKVYIEPSLAVCNRMYPPPPAPICPSCESIACPPPVECPTCPTASGACPQCPTSSACPQCPTCSASNDEPLTAFVAERLSTGVPVTVPKVSLVRGSNASLWLVGAVVLAGVGTGAYMLGKRASGGSKTSAESKKAAP